MRYRKNIHCLTTEELHDLREGLAAMYALPASDPNSFARVASFHGGPPTAYCEHGAPGFFTWHRAYLMAFENALRAVSCDVALPYWDWSSAPTTGVPEACRHPTYINRLGVSVANPLFSGPRPGGGQTSRRSDINTTAFDDLATSAQSAMTASTFSTFQSSINGVHGSVHVRTGGDMGFVPTASYDPLFFLHHANVDRLWAAWQSTHPGTLPATEASLELQPFNRPYTTQHRHHARRAASPCVGKSKEMAFSCPVKCEKSEGLTMMQQRYGSFEQLVQRTLRQAQDESEGTFKYHSSPLRGDRRYYFLNGETGTLEVACVAATDDAEWTFVNPSWLDQNPRWNQFQAHERNEAFLQMKVRELRVRLGLPWAGG